LKECAIHSMSCADNGVWPEAISATVPCNYSHSAEPAKLNLLLHLHLARTRKGEVCGFLGYI
jgi:hypothetical protein